MPILYQKDWINEEWFTEHYQQHKKENFSIVKEYLAQSPQKILDIGCGLAWESRMFADTFDCELYLLDGDYENNSQDRLQMQARYCEDAKDFAFYYKLDFLKQKLDELNTKNYTLVDCNNIDIKDDVKFDLITSWVSCGFHYPVSTYRDLITKHSHEHTVVIMDLRVLAKAQNPIKDAGVEIVKVLNSRPKYVTAQIRFV
jgi:SAM-dependent methyltransferase